MDQNLYKLFIKPIHDAGLEYLSMSTIAVDHYCNTNTKAPIQLALRINAKSASKIVSLFQYSQYYTPKEDVYLSVAKKGIRGNIRVVNRTHRLNADLFPFSKNKEVDWAWDNKQKMQVSAEEHIYVPPPEYAILWELLTYKENKNEDHLCNTKNIIDHCPNITEKKEMLELIEAYNLYEIWITAKYFKPKWYPTLQNRPRHLCRNPL